MLKYLLLFLLPYSYTLLSAQSTGDERPNILLFISDDQSWTHTSIAGEKAITTPAFDRIAKEGLYFTQAFCASPSCSPSRGSLLTGQEMWRLGEAANLFSAVPKALEKLSFPLLLQESGYFVGYTQKGWAPNNFKLYGWEQDPLGKRYNVKTLHPPSTGMVKNDYAGNFETFLDALPQDKPFFFWFGSSEPHRRFEANSGIANGIKADKIQVPGFLPDVPEVRKDIADYLWEIKWTDEHLGKMMQLLEDKGILDNTLIIATSDNGMAFPGAKNTLYEYGIHMPLAIRWEKGIQRPGRNIEDLVSLSDLAPTLLQCAGLAIPDEMTGKSLLKIFSSSKTGKIDKSRKYVFAGKERHTICREGDLPYPQRSIRDHRFLFIRNYEPDRWPAGSPHTKSSHGWVYGDIDQSPSQDFLLEHKEEAKVKEFFAFAMAKRPYEELYDIRKDPACQNNLILHPQYQKDRKRLAKKLDKYLLKTGDPRTLGEKTFWDDFPYYFENPTGITPYSNVKAN